jgi:ribose 5-phosphate isomerase B
MKIYIGTDHAGFELKEKLKPFIESLGYEVEDFGAYELNKDDDYPDFVKLVAKAVSNNSNSKGVILGGSGQGEAIVANRFNGVRSDVYYGSNLKAVKLSREHNDANILSLGARFLDEGEAKEAVKLWLETPFSNAERHNRRIKKIDTQDEFDEWNILKKETDSSESGRFFNEGDVFYIRCGKNIGFEEDGKGSNFERPVLIVKKFNKEIFTGVPLSTTKKTGVYYFKIGEIDGKENTAIISQARLIDSKRIINKIGFVNRDTLEGIKNHIKKYIF